MNRRQRKVHRGVFVALAAGAPLLLYAALSARPGMPGATDLPDWLDGPTRAAVRTLVEQPTSSLRVVLEEGDPGLELRLPRDWNEPDALVYWSAETGAPVAGAPLPADARLLGALDGRRTVELRRPAGASALGSLWIFSPARSTVVDGLAVGPAPDGGAR